MKAVLSDYTLWQGLSCRDALEQYNAMQSRLSNIASICSGLNVPQLCEPCPRMSFQMSGLSQMLSFGDLGKIVVGGGGEWNTRGRDGEAELRGDTTSTDPQTDPPPTKKRKSTVS